MTEHLTRGTYDDGRHFLSIVDAPEEVQEIFEELDLQGGGYTWIAVLHSLAELADPPIDGDYEIDGEADNAFVNTDDPRILDAFQTMIERAMQDPALLRRAIDEADPDLLE